jgi:WD40 repeat protein
VCGKEKISCYQKSNPNSTAVQSAEQSLLRVYLCFPCLLQGVRCFCLDRSKQLLATGSNDCVVRLWNPVVTKQPQVSLFGHKAAVVDVLIMRHLGAVFSCSQDGVSVSDLENVKLYSVLTP